VKVPMLFTQGTRDALADPTLMRALAEKLGKRATLHEIDGGDHSFDVPASAERAKSDVLREVADAFAAWVTKVAA
jgi:hypothetical protein